ncbi:MAG: hypothetical protein HRU33_02760 [Rhodobacteraceae bacterium]|nr:hypothetical protein [Paracoccaceae bacterium]
MPHAEIKYSTDLNIDPRAILATIEAVILEHDDSAGDCKGRGYPTSAYHHSHITISVALLAKPHRDEDYIKALLRKLEARVKVLFSAPCAFSLGLEFLTPFYVTSRHKP